MIFNQLQRNNFFSRSTLIRHSIISNITLILLFSSLFSFPGYISKISFKQKTILLQGTVQGNNLLFLLMLLLSNKILKPYHNYTIFFPRIDDSHCNSIHSSLTAIHCFDNAYVGKQSVACKEY